MKVKGPTTPLLGEVRLPGDKSISHRALLHAALSPQESILNDILRAGVTTSMIDCLRELGVHIKEKDGETIAEIAIETKNQDGATVITGSATAKVG